MAIQVLSSIQVAASQAGGPPIPTVDGPICARFYVKQTAGILHRLKGTNQEKAGFIHLFDSTYAAGQNPDLFDASASPVAVLAVGLGSFDFDWGSTGRPFANSIALAFSYYGYPYVLPSSANIAVTRQSLVLDVTFE